MLPASLFLLHRDYQQIFSRYSPPTSSILTRRKFILPHFLSLPISPPAISRLISTIKQQIQVISFRQLISRHTAMSNMDLGGIMGYRLDGQHARSKLHSKITHHQAQQKSFSFYTCLASKRSLYTSLYLSFRWPTNCFVGVDDKRQSILAELHPE